MNQCDNIRSQIYLYLDNEVTPEQKQFIEEHLKNCPACRTLCGQERGLEQKLTEIIRQPAPSDEVLWNKSLTSLKTNNRQFIHRKNPILKYLIPVAAAALVMIVLGTLLVFLPNSSSDLLAEVSKEHQRFLDSEEHLSFKTDSPDELVKYFGAQYDFNIPECKCLMRGKGFCFKGGGMCELKQRAAAHMVICYQNTPISLFALPEKDMDVFPGVQAHLSEAQEIYLTKFKDFNCAIIKLNKNIICAIGSVSPETLKQLLIDIRNGKPVKRPDCCNGHD